MKEDIYTKAFKTVSPRAAKIFPIKMLHSALIYACFCDPESPVSNQNDPFLIT